MKKKTPGGRRRDGGGAGSSRIRAEPAGRGAPGERRNPLPGGNEPFTCERCRARVGPLQNGSIRNHCPECLWSLHVDRVPGDRAESCGGPLEPVELEGSAAGGWTIAFRCKRCGAIRKNRAAHDDPVQPDRWDELVRLSTNPSMMSGRPARRRNDPPIHPGRTLP